jgi:hypothetical protein
LFFAEFLFSTVLHKLLHHIEVGFAVAAAASLHHLVHHQIPQKIGIKLFLCAFSSWGTIRNFPYEQPFEPTLCPVPGRTETGLPSLYEYPQWDIVSIA